MSIDGYAGWYLGSAASTYIRDQRDDEGEPRKTGDSLGGYIDEPHGECCFVREAIPRKGKVKYDGVEQRIVGWVVMTYLYPPLFPAGNNSVTRVKRGCMALMK